MKSYVIYLSLLLILLSAKPKDPVKSEVQVMNSYKIEYVSLYITTFGSINCLEFTGYFREDIQMQELSKEQAEKFFLLVGNLEKDNSIQNIDTRAIIYPVNGNSSDSICISLNAIEYQNERSNMSEELRDFLEVITGDK